MTEEREELSNTDNIQEKNRQNLEFSKAQLKKELESIKKLAGITTTEDTVVKAHKVSPIPMIPEVKYKTLMEQTKILKSENQSFRLTISMIENENNSLRESVEALTMEQVNYITLSNEVSSLRETLTTLESENSMLKEKLSEATSGIEKYSEQHLQITSQNSNEDKISIKTLQTSETVNHPQVHHGYTVPPMKPKKLRWKTSSKSTSIRNVQNSSAQSEDFSVSSELDKEKIISETVRRRCPTCNNTNKKYIRELTDKSNILMHYPRIYGKFFRCGICTTEWK